MSDKYEPLPLHLCEMLEQEFKKMHDPSYKADWLLEDNLIKGKKK